MLLVLFFGVVLAIFLVPLCISSPCIMEPRNLARKPALVGHRGAPMVSGGQNNGKAGWTCTGQALAFPATSSPIPFPSWPPRTP